VQLSVTLTEREKAIILLLLSSGDDHEVAQKLLNIIKIPREEWVRLESDLEEFFKQTYIVRNDKDGLPEK
jgi:hypothetical protein